MVVNEIRNVGNANAKPKKRELSTQELMDLLDPKRRSDFLIKQTFKELPEKFNIILVQNMSNYNVVSSSLVHYFVEKGMRGVFITINKHVKELVNQFQAEKIPIDNIIFVDAVTRMSGGEELKGGNFVYVDSPKDMLGLSVTAEAAMDKFHSGQTFVIMDSLTTLLVYNKKGAVEKFVHSMTGKIKTKGAHGVMLIMDTSGKEVVSTLAPFCDKIVNLPTT